MRILMASALAAAAIVGAQRASADTSAPIALATTVLGQIEAGKLDRSLLAPNLNAALTDTALVALAAKLAPLGMPSSLATRASTDLNGVTTYTFHATWSSASADYVFGLDDATGKITTLYVLPGPTP